jgi:putative tricarboxylic transport membrane protein
MVSHPRDFCSGLIFGIVGLATVYFGRESSMGTATKMGPGYFPTVLGMLLALIGLGLVVRGFIITGERIRGFALQPLVLVLGATLIFGLLVRGAGILVSVAVLVLVSAAASRLVVWRAAVALAVGLAGVSAIVFVKLLGLPIPLLGRWFGG